MSSGNRLKLALRTSGIVPAAPSISGTPDTTATVGQPYSWTPSISGGSTPLVVSLYAGTLPSGLSLNPATGEISGTPTISGVSAALILRITDAIGRTADLTPFDITVSESAGTLPSAASVPLGAETFAGYGGYNLGYTGLLWLAVYTQDGVAVVDNYSTAPSAGNKFKVTKENVLVYRGNCTFAGVLPTGLNNSYDLVIREYPTEADAIARTNWTGQEQATYVQCKGTWQIPAASWVNPNGSPYDAPAHDVNLTNTFCVAPWPRTVVSSRYPSGYTTTNEVLLESENNFQMNRAPLALGHFLMRQPGAYNPPYYDGVHDGTVDLNIAFFGTTPSGTFSGTAPLYEDANWLVVVDTDASQTNWNQINMYCRYIWFRYCNFNALRPTLWRAGTVKEFQPYDVSSSSIGAFRMALTSGASVHEFIRARGCNLAPSGITHEAGMNALMISTSADTASPPNHIFIEDNTIDSGYDAVNIGKNFFGTPTNPGEHLYITGNMSYGNNTNDQFKCYGYADHIYIQNNRIAASNAGFGSHPDYIQILNQGLPAGGHGPVVITGNDFTVPVADHARESGQGIVMPYAEDGSNWAQDVTIAENTYIGGFLNFVVLTSAKNVSIHNNTVSINKNQTKPPAANAPGDAVIALASFCDTVDIVDNILGEATTLGGATNVTQTNNIISSKATVGTDAITNVFNAPAYGTAIDTHAKLVDAFKARLGGPADGTGSGGGPIGRWNSDAV